MPRDHWPTMDGGRAMTPDAKFILALTAAAVVAFVLIVGLMVMQLH
jgi:hypothetical protein